MTKTKFINTMDKKVIKNITLFEVILFSLLTTIGTAVYIGNIFNLSATNGSGEQGTIASTGGLDAPVGVIAAMSLSRKGKGSPILLSIDALLYGTANFLSGQVALGVVNAIFTPLLGCLAFFGLGKVNMDSNGSEVKTRKLSLKSGLLLALGIVAVATSFAVSEILGINPISPDGTIPDGLYTFRAGFDSFAATLMLSAVILGILRFRETGFLYLLANAMKLILFSLLIGYHQGSETTLFVIATAYFINTIYGMFIGSNVSEKES